MNRRESSNERIGPRPRTTTVPPHRQTDQFPPASIAGELLRRCFSLPDIVPRPSPAAMNCTYSLWLPPHLALGPAEAFLAPGEFAYLHPLPAGGLHLTLPSAELQSARAGGWAESHPMIKSGALTHLAVLLYAPRNRHELEVVFGFISASYGFARGAVAPKL